MFIGATFLLTAYLNPWTGTKNVYLWSSNYGHDSSVIRLITPGFFDFFKYLQFAVFLASLSLDYPAFLQPIVSTFAWSCLLFPTSLLAPDEGKLHDGLYVSNSTYGLQSIGQLNQISNVNYIWGEFMIYVLIVTGGVVLFCEVVALATWAWRKYREDTSDMRSRNFSFITGLVLRIFFNLFALPLLVFSFFQCFMTSRGAHVYLTVLAALVIVTWVLVAGFVSYHLVTTQPRHALFDDLSIILRYGTFYNTYNEAGSLFFLVDLAITLFRGVTIGAIQISGLAQIILLAMIELIFFFCTLIMRPYDKETSMNLISCLYSFVRFSLIFLSLPFLGSLDIDVVVRQWLGYVILLIHALVTLLFLMHSIQVTIEVISRYNGVGANGKIGAIYSLKQLSRRRRKVDPPQDRKEQPSYADSEMHKKGASLDSRAILYAEDRTSNGGLSPVFNGPGEESSVATTLLSRGYNAAYGNTGTVTHSSIANRESVFDDLNVSSPISDISSPGGSAPLSANPNGRNSGGYYRKPRYRTNSNSHDWSNANQYMSKEGPSEEGNEDDATTDKNGAELDAIRMGIVSPPPAGVDYAVREADVYYTKHGQYAPPSKKKKRHRKRKISEDENIPDEEEHAYDYGNFGSIDSNSYPQPVSRLSDYDETKGLKTDIGDHGERKASSTRLSRDPNSLIGLLDGETFDDIQEERSDKAGTSSGKNQESTGFLKWFKEKKQTLFSKDHEEPSIEPKGFEVIRRGPIRPYRKSESSAVSSSDMDSSTESESENEEYQEQELKQQKESLYAENTLVPFYSPDPPRRKMSVMNPGDRNSIVQGENSAARVLSGSSLQPVVKSSSATSGHNRIPSGNSSGGTATAAAAGDDEGTFIFPSSSTVSPSSPSRSTPALRLLTSSVALHKPTASSQSLIIPESHASTNAPATTTNNTTN